MKTHHKKSKKQKNSTRYNIAKRVREHKRRVKKEAKRLGVVKRKPRDPGIPNSWPFKAEMLEELERLKEKKEAEIEKKRKQAKERASHDKKQDQAERREANRTREEERRAKRAEEVERNQRDALRKMLAGADVLLEVLDARDPWGSRCQAFEAYAQEKGRKIIFVLTKADLVPPQVVAQWLQALSQIAPAVAVQAEAGREGLKELLEMLGYGASNSPGTTDMVGVAGYAGVGKKTLVKAMRREVRGPANWLFDAIGRLRPLEGVSQPSTRLAVRAMMPLRGSPGEPDPQEVVKSFLESAQSGQILRRFRLPAFTGVEGFLAAFAQSRSLKNKKGKTMGPEATARRFIAELSQLPGCFFAVPDITASGTPPALWTAHGAAKAGLEAAMRAQMTLLAAREPGPTAGALALSSTSIGPPVDIGSLVGDAATDADMDDEGSIVDGDDISDDEGFLDEEGEEEEFMSDDDMSDDDGSDV